MRYLIEREREERREERECYRVGFCSVLPFYRVRREAERILLDEHKKKQEACILLAL